MEQIIECHKGRCYEKLFDDSGSLIYDGYDYGLEV